MTLSVGGKGVIYATDYSEENIVRIRPCFRKICVGYSGARWEALFIVREQSLPAKILHVGFGAGQPTNLLLTLDAVEYVVLFDHMNLYSIADIQSWRAADISDHHDEVDDCIVITGKDKWAA